MEHYKEQQKENKTSVESLQAQKAALEKENKEFNKTIKKLEKQIQASKQCEYALVLQEQPLEQARQDFEQQKYFISLPIKTDLTRQHYNLLIQYGSLSQMNIMLKQEYKLSEQHILYLQKEPKKKIKGCKTNESANNNLEVQIDILEDKNEQNKEIIKGSNIQLVHLMQNMQNQELKNQALKEINQAFNQIKYNTSKILEQTLQQINQGYERLNAIIEQINHDITTQKQDLDKIISWIKWCR